MHLRLPFLKTPLPELASLPEPRRQELLARCLDDLSMQALAGRHMRFMRLGWAILPLALVTYLILWRTGADSRILIGVLVGGIVSAMLVMVGSVLLYHRRSSRQLRALVQAEVGLRPKDRNDPQMNPDERG
jgi:hypothetical protein